MHAGVRNTPRNLKCKQVLHQVLTRHVSSNFSLKSVPLQFTLCCFLCSVCVLSHSFQCSFRPYRAPSPNLPHHSVSASPVSQGYKSIYIYKHSLYPLLPPWIPSRYSAKNGRSQQKKVFKIIVWLRKWSGFLLDFSLTGSCLTCFRRIKISPRWDGHFVQL